ncbi:MAG: hypothetical protein ACRDZ5_03725 [Acidimicrobiales bacterium]
MSSADRMQHLTTVLGTFHGRVLAARLGAEGIPVEFRGLSDGPYPLQGEVQVYVRSEQLELAREILLADAVDEVFDDEDAGGPPHLAARVKKEAAAPGRRWRSSGPGYARLRGLAAAAVIALVVVLVVVGLVATVG